MRDEGVLLVELDGISAGEAYPGFDSLMVAEEMRLPTLFCDVEVIGVRAVG